MCIVTKQENLTTLERLKQNEPCPVCRGTGLQNEEARLLWERKEGISDRELRLLIAKKLYSGSFRTDRKTVVNFKITQMDLLQIIKQRGIWVPCSHCRGKGFVQSKNKGDNKNENSSCNVQYCQGEW